MTDWLAWHRAYDDPGSVQARRLTIVRSRIGESLEALGAGARVLSLCAGDGRDLIPELAVRSENGVEAVLVELDAELAASAAASAASAGLRDVDVRAADASLPESFSDALPVDLLLLCGIFGNVPDDDIRRTIFAVPAILRPGGLVIWTRGRRDGVDLRPSVRRWVAEAGLAEVAYDGEPELFGVGVARAGDAAAHPALPDRLFTFFR
jgi:methyltransferase family protein